MLCPENMGIEWWLLKNVMLPDEDEGLPCQSGIRMEGKDGTESE
jgi:hypothetical protein